MHSSKILLIDDEASILTSLQRLLRKESFDLWVTQSSEQALTWLEQEEFAVVMSDQKMAPLTGTEFLEKVQLIQPDCIRILLTGYAEAQAAIDAINHGAVYRFLTKPWHDDELKQTLRQALLQYHMKKENDRLTILTIEQNAELTELNQTLEQKVLDRTEKIVTLNKSLQSSLLATVQSMAGLGEMHSFSIGSHSKRVSSLVQKMLEKLGISGWEAVQAIIAASLHDIGKIGIPADILKHEHGSSLTANELEILKLHPIKGESVLLGIPNLEDAARIVRHHHENFNGSGYPDKLAGENIPLGSRLIAVANAYDNICNNTGSYHHANQLEKALLYLKSNSGSMFDPDCVMLVSGIVKEKDPHSALEVEIQPRNIIAGMILSRDLVTVRGILILPKGRALEAASIGQIQNILDHDPPKSGIYVYLTPPHE